ncbi:MAG: Na+/H+ antiporter NhaA [Acidimicrobiia bacterium]|nr:Na+/H+ antiporter NhaA [Acidimicrobiia bacterium]MDH5237365.1 Na+/H+ antiporter NhaA [Acidimicrobiia bacterium]
MIRFLAQEAASGALLLAATAVALLWANSAWSASYHDFWNLEIDLTVGSWHPFVHNGQPLTLEGWVNDALMALFFFVVGLEITSEVVVGELREPRVAALPAVAAFGGMVAPAAIYTVVNLSGGEMDGWGIPMATDIAFAVGVLVLLGPRVPRALKLFVLMLAIVDDIGAILVIAVFYTDDLDFAWLALALFGLAAIGLMRRGRVWYTPVYIVVGLVVWYATFRSGVHATIAGVAVGVMTPARPLLGHRRFEGVEDVLSGDTADPAGLRDVSWRLRESVSVSSRLSAIISPWTSFLIVPMFALANAGVPLSSQALTDAAASPVTIGIVLGLVIGKPLGIVMATLLTHRRGWARLPHGVEPRHIVGAGFVAGIGFTVALFIADLAFADPALVDQAVIGILAASAIASLIGVAILWKAPQVDREAT